MEREGFVRWRNNGWQWVGWNVDRSTWCKVMGSMIDCRWMQVYEHTEWSQGSTAWLMSRIELMTEDCRSEVNSPKIANITQSISNNLKSIQVDCRHDPHNSAHLLLRARQVVWQEQDFGLITDFRNTMKWTANRHQWLWPYFTNNCLLYSPEVQNISLRHRSHIHISALVFTSFSSLFSVISLNFSSTKLMHCISCLLQKLAHIYISQCSLVSHNMMPLPIVTSA